MKKYKIENEPVDTLEAYFGTILKNKENLIIPYINLGVSEHEFNKEKYLMYLDYSYIVALGIKALRFNSDISSDQESMYFGGESIGKTKDIFDIEIIAKDIFLFVNNDFKLSKFFWIPKDILNEKSNMDSIKVDEFVNNVNLSYDLKRLMGGDMTEVLVR
ncbi:hypothetical protein [Apibacter sp. HY039]|uniref:hypothetical protein n=1 Tax=Apibacter sp. HY039 TaxID=2501476 RepID=UPI000FEBBEA1|nr:hypothetical protein [Apibacter sp. HY039]